MDNDDFMLKRQDVPTPSAHFEARIMAAAKPRNSDTHWLQEVALFLFAPKPVMLAFSLMAISFGVGLNYPQLEEASNFYLTEESSSGDLL